MVRSAARRVDRCPPILPSLLDKLAAPGCPKIGNGWDRCGVHYLEPIDGT
jgi:hypothetical protein